MIDTTIVSPSNPFIHSQTRYLSDLQLEKTAENQTNQQTAKGKREDEFREAQEYLYELEYDAYLHPLLAASKYMNSFPNVPAYPLRDSNQDASQAAWRKFNKYGRPMERLFGSLDRPHLYTLHAEHLGLSEVFSDAENFKVGSYDRELIDGWKTALKEKLEPPYFWKLENATRFHAHAIASESAGLLGIPRDGEIVKRIKPGDEMKVAKYLYKPHAVYNELNLAMWINARRVYKGHLPHTKGFCGLPSVRSWNA